LQKQVQTRPQELAVVLGARALSYADLDRRSDRLAARLRADGILTNDCVGICLERSLDAMVAVLAVLKAGGAYVPLDPRYPKERLAFMIADGDMRFLITRNELLDLGPFSSERIITLVEGWENNGDRGGETFSLSIDGNDNALAYVIYTSGSTGQPKGVAMGRSALDNLIQWQMRDSVAALGTRTLQYTPLSFDVHFQELFSTWATGGTLVLVSDEIRLDPFRLLLYLEEQRIERLFFPFIALQSLAEVARAQRRYPSSLREIITAGEQLQITEEIREFFTRLPNCTLHNHYGPSETHVVTAYTLQSPPADWPTLPPIGKPLPGVEIHLIGEDVLPVAAGESGELYIAGKALAQGYHNHPELTAHRFVKVAGRRMYRTGDLARLNPDGDYEYLGRLDGQVKVRGHRVELGEIEVALNAHPQVGRAAVVAHEWSVGIKQLTAYVVPRGDKALDLAELRVSLATRLPDFMVPAHFQRVEEIPLTPSGKVDRRALPAPLRTRPELAQEYREPRPGLETILADIWRTLLRLDHVGVNDPFFELGGNSLLCVQMLTRLQEKTGRVVPVASVFRYPTIAGLAKNLSATDSLHPKEALEDRSVRRQDSQGIAIVGMAGRFPGAKNIEQFWHNLCQGTESVTFFSDQELDLSVSPEARVNPTYVKARGILNDVEKFDAGFFGIGPREAQLMDPQQRLFLETSWEALEHAGHVPEQFQGSIGLYAGAHNNTYFTTHISRRPDLVAQLGEFQTMLANEKDYLATRTAYALNLTGPAISVVTACSTSLVAVVQAVHGLLAGQCDLALAGGVTVICPQKSGYLSQEGGMLSPDGHCRPFDADAQGTLFSNGVGVVALKRLQDALADGDTIYAVIRGAALNNDGARKMSFTAPAVEGQAEVITMAQKMAGVAPDTISYIEAHGTATALGDPVEVEALTQAFRKGTDQKQFCGLGSVKGNFGHLVSASGVAGLIKTTLALYHQQLPATLHFHAPNPRIDWAASPFHVIDRLTPWPRAVKPRRAGVSSFGVGGTNAHVVLEEAPLGEEPLANARGSDFSDFSEPRALASGEAQLLVLSAREETTLHQSMQNLSAFLRAPTTELPDIAFTLQKGRRAFAHRGFVVARSSEEAAEKLGDHANRSVLTSYCTATDPDVIFMFPGQGTQYIGMGRELYQRDKTFRTWFDHCADIVKPLIGDDLRSLIFEGSEGSLDATRIAQPALFSICYALAQLWQSRGVRPSALLGHSVGEFVAACLAEVYSLEDGLKLVTSRAAMMQAQPAGAMLSIRLPEEKIRPWLSSTCSLASVNAPSLCVVSGPEEAISAIEARCAQEEIACRRLRTSHAFHSPMMDAVIAPFAEVVRAVKLAPPKIPIMSTVSATWLSNEQAVDSHYWAGHLRATVRFADGLKAAMQDRQSILLEVGPRNTLATLSRQQVANRNHAVVSTLENSNDGQGEVIALLTAAGRLWLGGVSLNWESLHNRPPRRAPLPTYPFHRQRYWADPIDQPQAPPVSMPMPEVKTMSPSHKQTVLAELCALLEESSGREIRPEDGRDTFFELGLDSLLLTQASILIQRKFKVPVTFRQLMEDLSCPDRLAAYLEHCIPKSMVHEPSLSVNGQGDAPKAFGAAARITVKQAGLSPGQQKALSEITQRYNARTKSSKEYTQRYRATLADPRVVSGFRPETKELVYPIVVRESKGCHLIDLDGNEYIDITCGFGSNFFGYGPQFLVEAITTQFNAGYEIGPQHPLAGVVAEKISRFTGMPRVIFCNTGSEAVLGALRLARTVTGRDTVAMFNGAYHGIVDEVIVRAGKNGRAMAAAAGIPASAVENVLLLDYGSPESLQILRDRAQDLAAVLVEPVQSRHPSLQPKAFLHELRAITADAGSALIFDEVITGFRLLPGGAQEWFDVRADLATYGKVVGGGLPIGIIAGKERFMDALDGGPWNYGDSSIPEAGVTYFAGTFVRHPLALAAAHAVLNHLETSGIALYEELNARTAKLVGQLNNVFEQAKAPLKIESCGSLFKVVYTQDVALGELLYTLLRLRGIHIWDARPCFLTMAHTDEDVAIIVLSFQETVREMQQAGFYPAPLNGESPTTSTGNLSPRVGARLGKDPNGLPAWYVPDPQRPGKYLKVGDAI